MFLSNNHSIKAVQLFLFSCFFFSPSLHAFAFAEGYSSAVPGDSAKIYSRVFTLYNLEPACSATSVISELVISYGTKSLKIGDRIHRNTASDEQRTKLVIEAFDVEGNFIPAVPIYVDLFPMDEAGIRDTGTLFGYSDMDYQEVVRSGKVDILVRWGCSEYKGAGVIDDRLKLTVEGSNGH